MTYCPICKKEYNTDITICPECNVGLLEGERTDRVPVFSLQKEDSAQRFVEYAAEQGLTVNYEYMLREDAYKIYVNKTDMKATLKLFASFHTMEAKKKKEAEEAAAAALAAANAPETEEEIADIPPEDVSIVASDIPTEEDVAEETSYISPTNSETAPEEEPIDDPELEIGETIIESTEEPVSEIIEEVIEEPVNEIVEETTEVIEEIAEEPASAPIFVEVERVSEAEIEESSVIDPSFIEFTPVTEKKAPIEYDEEVEEPIVVSAPATVIEEVEEPIVVSSPTTVIEEVEENAVELPTTSEPEISEVVEEVKEVEESISEEVVLKEEPSGEEDAFSSFLTNFKKASLSKSQKQNAPIVEEIDPKAVTEDAEEYHSINFRPTDISDTPIKVSADSLISEEVLDGTSTAPEIDMTEVTKAAELAKEAANPVIEETVVNSNPNEENAIAAEPVKEEPKTEHPAPASKPATPKPTAPKVTPRKELSMDEELDNLDNYAGFVPDYSYSEETKKELTAEEKALQEFKKRAEERHSISMQKAAEKQKEQARQANLVKDLANGQKIVFEDTDELDNYAGFIPDYTPNTSNEAEFDFYKPHTIGSYAKYKKGKKSPNVATTANTYMRGTNAEELQSVFISNVPANVKRTVNANDLKTGNFLFSMSGSQITKLFTSWMMMNITAQSVRSFEKLDATPDEKEQAKKAGIKEILKDNFGDLNDSFLDAIVERYYSKYLDD